jgi:hypothetical protein
MIYDKENGRGRHRHSIGAMVTESFRREATQEELLARARDTFFPDADEQLVSEMRFRLLGLPERFC